MQRTTATMFLALGVCATAIGCAHDTPATPTGLSLSIGNPMNTGSKNAYTLAVIGDTPYGAAKLAQFPSLIALINSDPKVDVVVHLGDIKTGTNSPCTNEYFANVKVLFDAFQDPFVYTPGDNEWTDCHVAGTNNGLYTPTERLQAVRTLFFPVAGQTLGGRKKQVLTQADDPANSAYIENTMWMESQVVFAALNVPGSNNDRAPWGSPLPANAGTSRRRRRSRLVVHRQRLLGCKRRLRQPASTTRPESSCYSKPTCGLPLCRCRGTTPWCSRLATLRRRLGGRSCSSKVTRTPFGSITRTQRARRCVRCTLPRPWPKM